MLPILITGRSVLFQARTLVACVDVRLQRVLVAAQRSNRNAAPSHTLFVQSSKFGASSSVAHRVSLQLGDGIRLSVVITRLQALFPPIRGRTHNTPDPAALYPYYCPGSSGATYPIVTVSVLVRPAELITINTNR